MPGGRAARRGPAGRLCTGPATSGGRQLFGAPPVRIGSGSYSSGFPGAGHRGVGSSDGLLVDEVRLARPVPAPAVAAVDRGAREHPRRPSGHPGQQPPVVLRLVLHAGARPAQGDLPGQGRVLHHAGHQGVLLAGVHVRRSGRCPSTARQGRRAGRAGHRRARAAVRAQQPAGHLPRGHPLAGRAAVPRQDRRGPAGPRVRRRRHPDGHGQHRAPSSRRGAASPSCVPAPASSSASRWTSAATRAWPATGSSSDR